MLNSVVLIGRLTKDPELRYTSQGHAVSNFTLAVDRGFGDKETDFIPVVAWRAIAESCANFLAKGSLACVKGQLNLVRYEKKDGSKGQRAEVKADRVVFLSKKEKPAEELGTEVLFDDTDVPF